MSSPTPLPKEIGMNTPEQSLEEAVELSVVMPCLNEADTVERCIVKAMQCFERNGWKAEVVLADNGSTDGSMEIARRCGARVVPVPARGYGNALIGGIEAARGRYIIMGDADDSYDFSRLEPFVSRLRAGDELVMGCRLPSGGGSIAPGAMPVLHRVLGNPILSWLAKKMFWMPTNDIYCGLRGFTRSLYKRLDLRCTGMEFATEMVIKASLFGGKIGEVPITLHPDGRRHHPPHLRTWHDGWRTLRFFLLYSPKWLFFLPGLLLMVLGVIGYAIAMPGLTFFGISFDAHTLLFATLALLAGYQAVLFSLLAKLFAVSQGLVPPYRRLERLLQIVNLERGLVGSIGAIVAGLVLLGGAIVQWFSADLGDLDYPRTMRWVIPGMTLTFAGFQTMLSLFFASLLQMRRKREPDCGSK